MIKAEKNTQESKPLFLKAQVPYELLIVYPNYKLMNP